MMKINNFYNIICMNYYWLELKFVKCIIKKKNIECLDREVDLGVERKFYLLKVYNN